MIGMRAAGPAWRGRCGRRLLLLGPRSAVGAGSSAGASAPTHPKRRWQRLSSEREQLGVGRVSGVGGWGPGGPGMMLGQAGRGHLLTLKILFGNLKG